MSLDRRTGSTIQTYLAAMDGAVPGLVECLHIVGSAVLDDFRPGISDINFVAVTSEPLSPDTMDTLEAVHQRLASGYSTIPLDGTYLASAELAQLSSRATSGPHVEAGVFMRTGAHGRSPMDWYALATTAEAVRGPPLTGLDPTSTQELDDDVVRSAKEAASRTWDGEETPEAVSSLVLGVTRLHYALVTGRLTSKSRAGLYGLITFPARYRPVLNEALRIRRGPGEESGYSDSRSRNRDGRDYVQMVADDIHETAKC